MAIGSLDKAGRLEQLRTYAAVQVRSGFRTDAEVQADVREAVAFELGAGAESDRLADEFVVAARSALAAEQGEWPEVTAYDRLQSAFAELERADIVVLQAIDDHWTTRRVLDERAAAGNTPRGIAYFTQTDVRHAVEHEMLEINLWHGSGANVADSDRLLTEVIQSLANNGVPAVFDEGRIEATVSWQRRLPA